MACDCEFKRRHQELVIVRELARKAAMLTGEDQIVFKKSDGTYSFVPDGVSYVGVFVEYVLS